MDVNEELKFLRNSHKKKIGGESGVFGLGDVRVGGVRFGGGGGSGWM